MKATLTIEVPDDFKKGDCENCPLIPKGSIIRDYAYYCRVLGVWNCPLEIQEKKDCTLEQDLTMLELD